LHRVTLDDTVPSTHLHDRAPPRTIEEQVGAGFSANTEPGHSVPLVGEEVLEENLELPAGHCIDGCHARALILLVLLSSAATESRHARQDEHDRAEDEEHCTYRPQRGTKGEQRSAEYCDGARGVLSQG